MADKCDPLRRQLFDIPRVQIEPRPMRRPWQMDARYITVATFFRQRDLPALVAGAPETISGDTRRVAIGFLRTDALVGDAYCAPFTLPLQTGWGLTSPGEPRWFTLEEYFAAVTGPWRVSGTGGEVIKLMEILLQ